MKGNALLLQGRQSIIVLLFLAYNLGDPFYFERNLYVFMIISCSFPVCDLLLLCEHSLLLLELILNSDITINE